MEININLLQFYSKNWQGSMLSTMHPWLLHMTLWQYWLWFSFFISMSFYFLYLIKILTYQRADIRGNRSSGDKRRNAWSEVLIVLFPIFWSINIVSNAFYYLRLLEGSNGYVNLTVQISAYQWGWKYCYNDSTYLRLLANPIKIGFNTDFVPEGSVPYNDLFFTNIIKSNNLVNHVTNYLINTFSINLNNTINYEEPMDRNNSDFFTADLHDEVFFSRRWLKTIGVIEDHRKNPVKNQLFQTGYWVVGQGVGVEESPINPRTNKHSIDPFRLLRSTGALVLPTRLFLRLMSCSEDITHSWAVPGLGIKMDCVPGRLFCLYNTIHREGVYFGQCSELCGWNHYNMPVIVYALSPEHFILWWELELHIFFKDKITMENPGQLVFTDHNNDFNHYQILNNKYK